MDYILNHPEDLNEPTLFDKLLPLLTRYQINKLKVQQMKNEGGKGKIALNAENKVVEAAMRQVVEGNQN